MTTALDESTKERVRYHLGYLNVEPSASIQLGFPSSSQPGFLVERAMNRLTDSTVGRVLRIISELDDIEGQQSGARKRLKAQQLGELKLRNNNEEPNEIDLLEAEYVRWAKKLADNLGVPLNPVSERFRGKTGGGSMNIRVLRSG